MKLDTNFYLVIFYLMLQARNLYFTSFNTIASEEVAAFLTTMCGYITILKNIDRNGLAPKINFMP